MIVASTAAGFGLGSSVLLVDATVENAAASGASVALSTPFGRANPQERRTRRLRSMDLTIARNVELASIPAINQVGPRPGIGHARLGPARSIASACLMAMN
jgi:acetyl-CoA carboxylase alpha subunit